MYYSDDIIEEAGESLQSETISIELGYLSNELNERAVTFDYAREEREWKIEDGMRADVPYSLEELEHFRKILLTTIPLVEIRGID